MDNNDIIELLDILYGMVTEAWGVPLGNDKCIIEREKAIEIINDIKANLPPALAEAKRLHDELEAVYNPHVDFDGVYALAKEHILRLQTEN